MLSQSFCGVLEDDDLGCVDTKIDKERKGTEEKFGLDVNGKSRVIGN